MKVNMNIANPEVMEDLMCGCNVLSETEYRDIVLAITEFACEIVAKTLGPNGKTTNIDDSTFTAPTKDGWTVLRNIRFSDALYNSIYNTINQISFDLVTKVGDGTTSALVGANIFMHIILETLEDDSSILYGMRQSELLDLINEVKENIVTNLKQSPEIHMVDTDGDFSDIYRIAYVSSNGNSELAAQIQDIYQKTKNPNIYVTLDPADTLKSEIQNGYRYDCKILNHKAYINSEDGTYKINTPTLVAIFDHNVTYNEHKNIISALSRYASAKNSTIVIVAPYFDDIITNILNTTINSFIQKNQIPNIVMMQIPMSTSMDRTSLSDFVLLTNAQIFDYGKVRALNVTMYNQDPKNAKKKIEDDLLDIEQYHFETVEELVDACVGTILRATIADKYILLEGYEKVYNPELYKNTIKEIEEEFVEISRRTNKSSNILSKDYLNAQQRYIKMLGKMGTLKVGAQTELEKHCLKDSVDDAVLACRSAYNNGYIRGLNLTTLKTISDMIDNVNPISKDQPEDHPNTIKEDRTIAILQMFYNVFFEMSMYVLRNKYPDINGVESRYEITRIDDTTGETSTAIVTNSEIVRSCVKDNSTFNLVTNIAENEWNVINSLSTDVEILNSIVGVLSILLTSNQFISLNKGYDKKVNRKMQLKREEEKAAAIERGRLMAQMEFMQEKDPSLNIQDILNAIFW